MKVKVSTRNCERGTLASGTKVVFVTATELMELLRKARVIPCDHCAARDFKGGNNGRVCREGAGSQCCTIGCQAEDGCWISAHRIRKARRLRSGLDELEAGLHKATAKYAADVEKLLRGAKPR